MGGESSKSESNKLPTSKNEKSSRDTEVKLLASSLSNRSAEEILNIIGTDESLQNTLVTISEKEWDKLKEDNQVLGDLARNQAKFLTNMKEEQAKEIKMFMTYMKEKYGNDEVAEVKSIIQDVPVVSNQESRPDYKYPDNLLSSQNYNPIQDYAAVESERVSQNISHNQAHTSNKPVYFNTGASVNLNQNMGRPQNEKYSQNTGQFKNTGISANIDSRQNLGYYQNMGQNMTNFQIMSQNSVPLQNVSPSLYHAQNMGPNTSQHPNMVRNNVGKHYENNPNLFAHQNMGQNLASVQNMGQNNVHMQNFVPHQSIGPDMCMSQNMTYLQNMGQNSVPLQNMGPNLSQHQNMGLNTYQLQNMGQNVGPHYEFSQIKNPYFNMETSQNKKQNLQELSQNSKFGAYGSHSRPQTPHNMEEFPNFSKKHFKTGQPLIMPQKSESRNNNASSYHMRRQNDGDFQRNTRKSHERSQTYFQNKEKSSDYENSGHENREVFRNTGAIPRTNNYRGRFPRGSAYRGQGRGQDFNSRYREEEGGRRRHSSAGPKLSSSKLSLLQNDDFEVEKTSRYQNFKSSNEGSEKKYKEYEVDTKPHFDKFQRGGYQNRQGMTRVFTESTDNHTMGYKSREVSRGGRKFRGNKSQTLQTNEKLSSKDDASECVGANEYINSLEKPKQAYSNNNIEAENKNLKSSNVDKIFANHLKTSNIEKKSEKDLNKEEENTEEAAKIALEKTEKRRLKNALKNAKRMEKKALKEAEEISNITSVNEAEKIKNENEKDDNLVSNEKLLKSINDYFDKQLKILEDSKKHKNEKISTTLEENHAGLKITEKISNEEMLQMLPSHWTVRNTCQRNYIKVPINENNQEYIDIANEFHKSVRNQMEIEMICRIENAMLWSMYLLKKEELTKLFGYEPEEKLLFHGTHIKNLNLIFENNFNWRKADKTRHKYGQGVIFTPLASNASHHCKGGGLKNMIVAKVMIAREKVGKEDMEIPPKGFDTTKRPDGKIIVKFDDSTFYPQYVISFSGRMVEMGKSSNKKVEPSEELEEQK